MLPRIAIGLEKPGSSPSRQSARRRRTLASQLCYDVSVETQTAQFDCRSSCVGERDEKCGHQGPLPEKSSAIAALPAATLPRLHLDRVSPFGRGQSGPNQPTCTDPRAGAWVQWWMPLGAALRVPPTAK